MKTMDIVIDEIVMNDDRTEGGKGDIESLARNMDKYGQINAVMVVKDESTPPCRYRIIAGRRRTVAAQSLGWTTIRADVYEADEVDKDSEEMIALSENAAREELNAIDEGILYAKELKKGTPVEELAALFCRNKSTVYQRAKLASLIPEMRKLYKSLKMPLHVAAMASDLPEEAQKAIADKSEKRGYCADWEIKSEIRNMSNDLLRSLGDCTGCASCTKRTRYSDKTLFPELAESDDRCLDHGCYCRKLQERITGAFKKWSEESKGSPELNFWAGKSIFSDVVLPDGIQVLGIEIQSPTGSDYEDITKIDDGDEDAVRAKEKLEADGKALWVPLWTGTEFRLAELVNYDDYRDLYFNEEAEESEWEKQRREEADYLLGSVPDERRKQILSDTDSWYRLRNEAREIFDRKMQDAVDALDEKPLVTEKLALVTLLMLDEREIREFLPGAGITEDDGAASLAAYEKLLAVRREDMFRALLKDRLHGYRTKPEILGLDDSDWPKIFAHIGIDLAALRDEALDEFAGTVTETGGESDDDE